MADFDVLFAEDEKGLKTPFARQRCWIILRNYEQRGFVKKKLEWKSPCLISTWRSQRF